MINAWRKVRRGDAELWLVGPAAKQTTALIRDLPGLKYRGALPHNELPALLAQCDVFVFPSYFEGFGLVILEAMASGLPVITTAATAGPDLFSNGDGGWLMQSGNTDELVELMDACLVDRERVTRAGKRARMIAEDCSWQKYGDRWAAILNSIVERAPLDAQ